MLTSRPKKVLRPVDMEFPKSMVKKDLLGFFVELEMSSQDPFLLYLRIGTAFFSVYAVRPSGGTLSYTVF